jgi:cobalamin-dependent methionine synthase I
MPYPYHVDRAEALRYLGYAGQQLDASLDERIDAAIAHCEEVSRPAFVYRLFPVDASHGDIRLVGSSLVLPGNDIYRHLSQAREVAAMACTLGLANEREAMRLKSVDALDAALFGSAGSSLVESVADVCEAKIVAEAAARGLHTNWRYSPGYGDLPLDVQPTFVRVLDATRRIGLTVTSTNLLVPAKSVTALVGLFDTPQDSTKKSCSGCVCHDYCSLRKAGTPCWK